MRRFMKFCGITAVILIAAGAGIATISSAIQGPASISSIVDSVTRGNVQINLDSADSFGDAVSDSLEKWDSGARYDVQEDLEKSMKFASGYEILKGNAQQSFSAEDVTGLDIEAGACHVTIKDSSDGDFHVEAENAGKFQSYLQKGTLCVKALRRTGIGNDACGVTLYIPAGFQFREVDVEMGAGVLEFGDLCAVEADFEVGAGQILGDSLHQTDELELKVGVGEISIDSISVRKLEAEVGMGALSLSGLVTGEADLECSMGSIEMELEGSENDYNYKLESAMGSVEIGSYSASGPAKEKKIDNKAACDISLECSMGSIVLTFTE